MRTVRRMESVRRMGPVTMNMKATMSPAIAAAASVDVDAVTGGPNVYNHLKMKKKSQVI
jgi:hypothetical protein